MGCWLFLVFHFNCGKGCTPNNVCWVALYKMTLIQSKYRQNDPIQINVDNNLYLQRVIVKEMNDRNVFFIIWLVK